VIVEYHPAIHGELETIRDYYNEKVPGLGTEFLEEVNELLLRIAHNPKRWMRVSPLLRRALMKRFPYVIYFRELEGKLRITVVKHQRRHPSLGRTRR
jgi:toxin ParE1/3/4